MAKRFTPQNFSNGTVEINQHKEVRHGEHSKGVNLPSESVIQHLLNYSKALTAIDSKFTGKKSLLLLN